MFKQFRRCPARLHGLLGGTFGGSLRILKILLQLSNPSPAVGGIDGLLALHALRRPVVLVTWRITQMCSCHVLKGTDVEVPKAGPRALRFRDSCKLPTPMVWQQMYTPVGDSVYEYLNVLKYYLCSQRQMVYLKELDDIRLLLGTPWTTARWPSQDAWALSTNPTGWRWKIQGESPKFSPPF